MLETPEERQESRSSYEVVSRHRSKALAARSKRLQYVEVVILPEPPSVKPERTSPLSSLTTR